MSCLFQNRSQFLSSVQPSLNWIIFLNTSRWSQPHKTQCTTTKSLQKLIIWMFVVNPLVIFSMDFFYRVTMWFFSFNISREIPHSCIPNLVFYMSKYTTPPKKPLYCYKVLFNIFNVAHVWYIFCPLWEHLNFLMRLHKLSESHNEFRSRTPKPSLSAV